MPIEFSIDNKTGEVSINNTYDRTATLSQYEKIAMQVFNNILKNANIEPDELKLERRSQNYLSVITKNDNDFCRIKAGNLSLWFSLDFWNCKEIHDDIRLSHVTNKRQRHWKIPLKNIYDLENYNDLIILSYNRTISEL